MGKLFSSYPHNYVITFLRVTVGLLLIVHGIEVFDTDKMQEYVKWESFSSTSLLPYIGKASELLTGILFTIGLFTRMAAIITILTFTYITFFIGNGKFWMDDQHPFMFVLFGVLFLFIGAGACAIDNYIFKLKKNA